MEARHIATNDDVRPRVLQEATRLAHGGSSDVKPELFEGMFGKEMEKYDRFRQDLDAEAGRQEQLLAQIRVSPTSSSDAADLGRSRMRRSWGSGKMTLG